MKCHTLLAALPSAKADQKTIDVHFYCDVLVRAPSLSGLHKQKALHRNQHSPKAQTCLIWNLDRSSLSLPARRKNNNSSICCSWGRPRSPLIVICYLRCDMRDAHTALQSLGGRSPEKQDASWCNIWLEGLERWVERRKNGSKRNKDVLFILYNDAGGDCLNLVRV